MPVEYENDVNLAAVAEQRLGAARGHDDFVLLWNEEGLGAALVIGGRLHRGWTGGAGEVGFLPVPGTPLVRNVTRANNGGFQELAGCRRCCGMARELGIDDPGRPAARRRRRGCCAGPPPHQERRAARRPAPELLRPLRHRHAVGLASLVAVLDPELIVLAGDVAVGRRRAAARPDPGRAGRTGGAPARLVLGAVEQHPVLRGALESALAATRDEVFDTSR